MAECEPDGAASVRTDLKAWPAPYSTVSGTEEAEGNGGGGTDFASEVS